jgi:hypothetical protein
MRLLVAVLACSSLLALRAAMGGSPASFAAYVNGNEVCVRSGPGESYYPTERLKLGQEVDVYRIDPGGWCAVRPVEGSFTWVSAQSLKPTDNKLAAVTEDNVPARVGSNFSDARDVVQVRLRKGELVEMLEPPPRDAKTGGNTWVKIAPPSGEFRWVSGKYLDSSPPKDGVRNSRAARQTPPTASEPSSDGSVANPPRADLPLARPLSPEAYQKELDRLELELSSTLTEETALWSFDSLRDRANWLLDRAQTAVERGRARTLANKITRFEDIKHRYDSAHAMRDRASRPPRLLASLPSQGAGSKDEKASDSDDRFDGVGRLTTVASPKLGAPRYALLDDTGDVRCYVTPAPGLNLRGYVGKQVGVTGTRGYMPEQHASHLMARHIAVLDGILLR